jgi:hypothetical protein
MQDPCHGRLGTPRSHACAIPAAHETRQATNAAAPAGTAKPAASTGSGMRRAYLSLRTAQAGTRAGHKQHVRRPTGVAVRACAVRRVTRARPRNRPATERVVHARLKAGLAGRRTGAAVQALLSRTCAGMWRGVAGNAQGHIRTYAHSRTVSRCVHSQQPTPTQHGTSCACGGRGRLRRPAAQPLTRRQQQTRVQTCHTNT